ncbi:MAG TPA: TraB/GumN family protein, partial [Stellaceae bacterium]|nr:TraB/GumN family protein [Stellaceae bacterium]
MGTMMGWVARSFRTLAVCLLATASVPVFLTTAAGADPGLWVAKGPSATVYLFGTIHLLRKDQVWETPAVAAALARSGELWLEVPDPNNAQKAHSLVQQLGFDRAHPLSGKLPPDMVTHLDNAAKSLGIAEGEKAFEPMRPWLVTLALGTAAVVHAGYDPASGVESALLRDASAAGIPVRGFETLDGQMHFFADMKPALQVELLQNTLQELDRGPEQLSSLIDAWLSGDDTAIAKTFVDEVKQPFPALYRTLLVDRNEAWAKTIATMLKGSGVRFVAVGAAHLAGPDSV